MQPTPEQLKTKLLETLDEDNNVVDMAAAVDVLSCLENTAVTKEVLKHTRLGMLINLVRKRNQVSYPEISRRCKNLVKDWQKLISIPSSGSSSANASPAVGVPAGSASSGGAFRKSLTPGISSGGLSANYAALHTLSPEARSSGLTKVHSSPSLSALAVTSRMRPFSPIANQAVAQVSPIRLKIKIGGEVSTVTPVSLSAIEEAKASDQQFSTSTGQSQNHDTDLDDVPLDQRLSSKGKTVSGGESVPCSISVDPSVAFSSIEVKREAPDKINGVIDSVLATLASTTSVVVPMPIIGYCPPFIPNMTLQQPLLPSKPPEIYLSEKTPKLKTTAELVAELTKPKLSSFLVEASDQNESMMTGDYPSLMSPEEIALRSSMIPVVTSTLIPVNDTASNHRSVNSLTHMAPSIVPIIYQSSTCEDDQKMTTASTSQPVTVGLSTVGSSGFDPISAELPTNTVKSPAMKIQSELTASSSSALPAHSSRTDVAAEASLAASGVTTTAAAAAAAVIGINSTPAATKTIDSVAAPIKTNGNAIGSAKLTAGIKTPSSSAEAERQRRLQKKNKGKRKKQASSSSLAAAPPFKKTVAKPIDWYAILPPLPSSVEQILQEEASCQPMTSSSACDITSLSGAPSDTAGAEEDFGLKSMGSTNSTSLHQATGEEAEPAASNGLSPLSRLRESNWPGVNGSMAVARSIVDGGSLAVSQDESSVRFYDWRSCYNQTHSDRQIIAMPYVDVGLPDFSEFNYPDSDRFIIPSSDFRLQ